MSARPPTSPVLHDGSRILIRATNWLGDCVMSMAAVKQVRSALPRAHLAVLARAEVADLYRQPWIDEVILWTATRDWKDLRSRWRMAAELRPRGFDAAILLQNAFDAALVAWLARIPIRIGYAVKRRGMLLTHGIPWPAEGTVPRHQSARYLHLLERSGITRGPSSHGQLALAVPETCGGSRITRLPGDGPWIGIAPGSSNGRAKRWLPERFAEASAAAASALGARLVIFGSPGDADVCAHVAEALRALGTDAVDLSGKTDIRDLLALTSACDALLANDSGSMHIADALGVPTVAVFGPTCERSTGPTGHLSVVVRQPVECSPCLLHECPIDHRCMRGVESARVAAELIRVAIAGRDARCPRLAS